MIEAVSSGRDVPIATAVMPMIASGTPITPPTTTAPRTSSSEPIASPAMPPTRKSAAWAAGISTSSTSLVSISLFRYCHTTKPTRPANIAMPIQRSNTP